MICEGDFIPIRRANDAEIEAYRAMRMNLIWIQWYVAILNARGKLLFQESRREYFSKYIFWDMGRDGAELDLPCYSEKCKQGI